MDILKHLPLVMGLVIFTVYYFSYGEKKIAAGFIVRAGVAAVSTLLFVYLFMLFMGRHYEFRYVYENSSNALTPLYRVSAVWAGQAGTFLLWYWLTALLLVAMKGVGRKYERGVYMALGLVLVMLGVFLENSNPFELLKGLPAGGVKDGMGLNPLLVNPWMAIHPPLVFVGYGLIAAPFAVAAAGALAGDVTGWPRVARPWALAAWAFLGAGIFLGSYWAYEVLGWGGYWGWDPVENASIFPWLALGGLVHGVIIQGGGKRFSLWNTALALGSMVMVVVTAYLTRSGALSSFSVHSFEKSSLYYPLTIALIAFAVYSVVLSAMAYMSLKKAGEKESEPPLSAKLLQWTIIVLLVLLGFVTVGTMYPLVTGLSGKAVTVAQSYYNKTTFLMALPLGALLAICPFIFLKTIKGLAAPVRYGVVAAAAAGAAGLLAGAGIRQPVVYALGLIGGAAAGATAVAAFHFVRLKRWNAAAYLVHLGVGLVMIGVLTTSVGGKTEQLQLLYGAVVKDKAGNEYSFKDVQPRERTVRVILDVKTSTGMTRALPIEFAPEPGSEVIKPGIIRSAAGDLYITPLQIEVVSVASGQGPQAGGETVMIGKDQKAKVGEYELQLERWNIEHMQDQGVVIAVVSAVRNGKREELELPFSADPTGRSAQPPTILGDGTKVRVNSIDASSHIAELQIGDGPVMPHAAGQGEQVPRIHFAAGRKPFIAVLWWGMILMCFGTFGSLFIRRGGAARDEA